MNVMAEQLRVVERCGVYQLTREPYETERAARKAQLAVFRVDIARTHDKLAFIGHLAEAMRFPAWAGKNWDALNDCLTDLEWLDATGYTLILEKAKHFATAHQHEYDDAVAVMRSAADYWKAENRPFWVLIHGAQGWDAGLPKWPG